MALILKTIIRNIFLEIMKIDWRRLDPWYWKFEAPGQGKCV